MQFLVWYLIFLEDEMSNSASSESHFEDAGFLTHPHLSMHITSRRNKSLVQVMAFFTGGDNHQGHDVLKKWPSHFVLK